MSIQKRQHILTEASTIKWAGVLDKIKGENKLSITLHHSASRLQIQCDQLPQNPVTCLSTTADYTLSSASPNKPFFFKSFFAMFVTLPRKKSKRFSTIIWMWWHLPDFPRRKMYPPFHTMIFRRKLLGFLACISFRSYITMNHPYIFCQI